ncbi:Increased rDNA silencing protein [Neocucurbitaria cava]|uniref:Increased rDNA silencing protein n=1 Tax=Neocucurbitaria cava TaxID=798079 RepID=A0A9W8YFF5_9PLEO|nr:Increased rDNA silencing protein [Neocucurbitaria cava]
MSSARNQGLVPQSTGDTQYNVRDAALRGASLAFSKPAVQPKPQVNTYTGGNNGALLAATKVGTGRNSAAGSPASVKRDWTGGSSRSVSRPSVSPMQVPSKSNSSNSLGVPEAHIDRVPSPSNIAARLAAARYSPLPPAPQAVAAPTMSERVANERDILPPMGSVGNVLARLEPGKPSQQPRARRESLEAYAATGTGRREQGHQPTDDTRIPPTTSLVKMFEQNRPNTPTNPPTAPLNVAQNSPPPVRSPKPQRAFRMPPEPVVDLPLQKTKTQSPPPVKPKPKHRIELPPQSFIDGVNDEPFFNTPKKDPLKSPPIKQKPMQLTAIKTTALPPKPPPQRGSGQTRPMSQGASRSTSVHRRPSTSHESYGTPDSPTSFKSAKEEQEVEDKPKPSLPPPRRSNTRRTDPAPLSSKPKPTAPVPIKSRNQSQVPASKRPLEQLSPPRRPASATGTSPSMYHNNYQRQSVQQIAKHMTGESLSSAIVGAALAASSRNASPAPRPAPIEPLFPPRKQHHHHMPFHRSPSPQKQSPPKPTNKMRTTMRKEPSSSEDEDEVERYKKKGTRIMGIKGRKHPNKHHEGTRKRWRDQITERERKRYEGVWAANKGLFLTSPSSSPSRVPIDDDPALDVLNLCVQEIWTRSRLPIHVLEEVWDLVDGRGIGRLSRYEFVVGLWLIDQRLKGRKLPVRVSDSVWSSATGVGIKVKVRK